MKITEICNMALAYLGKGSISGIDEENEPARQCKRFYDHVRQQLLRKYYFSFAKRLTKLALLDYDHPKWDYVYAYPSKCLFIRKLYNEEEEAKPLLPGMQKDREKFEVFLVNDGVKAIGTNMELAYCEYTYDVSDEDVFPSDFVEVLARLLAYSICMPLTGDASLAQVQYQIAQQGLMEAKYTTAMEQYDKLDYPSNYADFRSRW